MNIDTPTAVAGATLVFSVGGSLIAWGKMRGQMLASLKSQKEDLDSLEADFKEKISEIENKCGDRQQTKCRKEFVEKNLFGMYEEKQAEATKFVNRVLSEIRDSTLKTQDYMAEINKTMADREKRRDEGLARRAEKASQIQTERVELKEKVIHMEGNLNKVMRKLDL